MNLIKLVLDGETNADGKNFEKCDSLPPVPPPDVCGLPKERGDEGDRNYTTQWFFDMEFGGCARYNFQTSLFELLNRTNLCSSFHEQGSGKL